MAFPERRGRDSLFFLREAVPWPAPVVTTCTRVLDAVSAGLWRRAAARCRVGIATVIRWAAHAAVSGVLFTRWRTTAIMAKARITSET